MHHAYELLLSEACIAPDVGIRVRLSAIVNHLRLSLPELLRCLAFARGRVVLAVGSSTVVRTVVQLG